MHFLPTGSFESITRPSSLRRAGGVNILLPGSQSDAHPTSGKAARTHIQGPWKESLMGKKIEANWEQERLGNQALVSPVPFLPAEAVPSEGAETAKLSAACVPSGTKHRAVRIGSTLQAGVQ